MLEPVRDRHGPLISGRLKVRRRVRLTARHIKRVRAALCAVGNRRGQVTTSADTVVAFMQVIFKRRISKGSSCVYFATTDERFKYMGLFGAPYKREMQICAEAVSFDLTQDFPPGMLS